MKAKGTPNLKKVEDINVVCGCLKDFLRGIREPILTYRMHPVFIQAIGQSHSDIHVHVHTTYIKCCTMHKQSVVHTCTCYVATYMHVHVHMVTCCWFISEEDSDEKALAATLEAIAQLPPCNKDTLAFLILHLQRLQIMDNNNYTYSTCITIHCVLLPIQ